MEPLCRANRITLDYNSVVPILRNSSPSSPTVPILRLTLVTLVTFIGNPNNDREEEEKLKKLQNQQNSMKKVGLSSFFLLIFLKIKTYYLSSAI